MDNATEHASTATLTLKALLKHSQAELDALYRASSAGSIPDGDTTGRAVVFPGTFLAIPLACVARLFFWQGKVFFNDGGYLLNKVSPLGVRAIKAKVFKGESWLDGRESIIIDYKDTSTVAGMVHDEIREVAQGLYLGKVYLWKKKSIDFALETKSRAGKRGWFSVPRILAALALVFLAYLLARFFSDRPVTYSNIEDHFKYGSTGGERSSGIPIAFWKALPELFPEYLPGKGYESLGFVYEEGKELPIGVSKRTVQGVDRVFLNCAVCHVGTVRETPESDRSIYLAMPANTVDLLGFQRFFFRCATDERFTANNIMAVVAKQGGEDLINRVGLKLIGVNLMRERMLLLRSRFVFSEHEPDSGPGRIDTFGAARALLNFPFDKTPERERVGLADFPSIWLQGQRKDREMRLHWDGNNDKMEERNLSAAFGTGAFPPTVDHASLGRVEQWLLNLEPPKYPFPIDATLTPRGQAVYGTYCAGCHGANGRDFAGEHVGKVTPIDEIKTDRRRLDSYTDELCSAQNSLYAGTPYRFSRFRKTNGYANMPLDGVWLRAPFLHNGSVPTLRALLEPANKRPKTFYRGYDVYDQQGVGFVANVASEKDKRYFLFDTSLPGNGNGGHEGEAYGTELSSDQKAALLEYLKTF